MMHLIRPEVRHRLIRWREVLAGCAATCLGLYWVVAEHGALPIFGTILVAGGALLVVAGFQRARFRQSSSGPGLVQVKEGQLAYFGPYDGGVADTAGITRLELDAADARNARWVIGHDAGDDLVIPVDAQGADLLFDVFASLPDIDTEEILQELRRKRSSRVVIWERHHKRLD